MSIYESAVQGRREFREAYRRSRAQENAMRRQIDRYGLALMMIREGCADPQGVAAQALAGQPAGLDPEFPTQQAPDARD